MNKKLLFGFVFLFLISCMNVSAINFVAINATQDIGTYAIYAGGTQYQASQTFLINYSSPTVLITNVSIQPYYVTSWTGTFINVSIQGWSNNTRPNGTMYCNGTYATTLSVTPTWYTINCSTILTNNTRYYLVIGGNGNANGRVGENITVGYNGNSFYTDTSGTTWVNRTPNDINFYITGEDLSSISKINLLDQSPANLTDISLFTQNMNIIYSYNLTDLSNTYLNYSVYGNSSCLQFLNGSCIKLNNTYNSKLQNINVSNATHVIINYSLTENDIYSYSINLNGSLFNSIAPTNADLSVNTQWYVDTQYNISDVPYHIYELMINTSSTGSGGVYVCNESYNFANPQSNSNCQLLRAFVGMTDYNHTHSVNNMHNLFPYTIINGKINGLTVAKTNIMYFVVRRTTGTVSTYYIPNVTRANTTRLCNAGTCLDQSFTFNAHDHFWSNNEYLTYAAFGNYSGSLQNSSWVTELIDVSPLAPNSPTITNPLNTTQSTRYMNITFTNASSNIVGGSISYYNISLLNSDLSFNRTIYGNNSLNNSYYWDVYYQNLSIGEYYIKVTAFDNLAQSSFDLEWFNLTRNAELNISLYNYTGSLISPSKIIYYYGFNDSIDSFTTSNVLDVVIGNSYNIFINASGYAYDIFNYSISDYVTFINRTLYPFNSLFFETYLNNTPYNATTTTIRLDGTMFNYSGSTDGNGMAWFTNVSVDNYTVTYINPVYGLRQKIVSVTEGSYQNISLILYNGTDIVFNFRDTGGNSLSNVYCEMFTSVTSVIPEQSQYSDSSGRSTFSMSTSGYNRLECTKTGYEHYQLVLNPVRFTSYTVTLLTSISYSVVPTGYVVFSPTVFFNNQSSNFSITFISPYNNFVSYEYFFTSSFSSFSDSGSLGGGENFVTNFTIPTTNDVYPIIINYSFVLDDGSSFNEVIYYSTVPYNSKTLVNLGSSNYGMLVGDRIIFVTLILIAVMGIAWIYTVSAGISLGVGGLVLLLFIKSGYLGVDGSSAFKIFALAIIGYFVLRAWYNR